MANEDFVVRFGSNAATFKDQLKRDIVEVNGLVSQLRTALQQGAALKLTADGKILRGPTTDPTIGRGAGGSGGGGGKSNDPHYDAAVGRLVDNLESYTQTLGGVIRSMDGAARLMEAAALAVKNRSSGKTRSEAAEEREARDPAKSNLANVRKVHEEALKAALDGVDKDDPFEANAKRNITNVPRVEIDNAVLDRIAQSTKSGSEAQVSTNRKMDHLIGLLNRGLVFRGDGRGGRGDGGGDGGGKGGKGGGTPAAPKGTPDVQDDAFSRVAQLRRFIQKRERETALYKELARLDKGEGAAPSGAAFQTLAGGSKGFKKVFEATGGEGEAYRSRVQKAIDSTRSELADVPRLKTLRSQLATAIEATGTPDGRLSREQYKARAAERQSGGKKKKETTSSSGHRAQETSEDKNTRLQRQLQESLAVVKGYQVVVAGLTEAIADVDAGRKQAPPGIDLQAKLAKAKQDLAEAEAAHKRAEAKAAGTRAERKAANRAEAEAVRQAAGPQITGRAARERLDNLDLAGSRDALQGLPVRRLREIASQFRTEGYDVKVPRGAKKEDLVGILNTVHGEFEKAGRATNSNLEARAQRHAPTTISPAARNAIGGLLGKVVQDVQSSANQEIISAAYKGGFSPGQGKQKASAEGAGRVYPVQNNRDEIAGAEESLAQRAARIAREATREGRKRLLSEPGFDPFHKDVEITGTGTGARDARFALRAIQEVVNRFDKLGQAALRAHDDLDKMNARLKRLDGLEKRADALSRSGLRTDAEKSQYTSVLSDIKALKPRVEADQARRPQIESELAEFYKKAGRRADRGGLGVEVPQDFFSRANFGAGFDARAASRDARLTMEMQRNDARAERITKATSSTADVSAAVREALFGTRNVAGVNGQVGAGIIRTGQSRTAKRVDQARMLPDVFNPELMARDFPKAGQDDILAAQRETRKYEKAIKKQRQMEQANRLASESGGPAAFSPDEITKQGAKIDERLKRLFGAIEKVTGQATARAEREEVRLRMIDPYGRVEAKNTRQSKAKQYEPGTTLSPGQVARAEKIIAGGVPTKDMPMAMGRLAKAAGVDYEAYKGQGIEGLRRLLALALQGPKGAATSPAAAGVKEAVKAGRQGGFDDDCCTKIVAGLNRIVAALQGGVRLINGRGDESVVSTASRPAAAKPNPNAATTPEERERRRQRIREEFQLAEKRGGRRLDKARSKEQDVATSQTMKEVAAANELDKTLKSLDKTTLGHIARLKEQRAAGADMATQYRTMEDIYRSGATRLRNINPAEGVGRRVERLGGVINSASGMEIPKQDIRRMGADIENELTMSMRAAADGNTGQRGPLLEALFGGKGFMGRAVNSIGTFLVRNFSAGIVFGVTNALQDMLGQALETEAAFIRISSALEATGRSSNGLKSSLQDISTDYGVALKDVYATAAGLTGVFGTNDELAQGTRVAAQLEIISRGALNSTEAMKALASVTTAFGLGGVEGLEHIADALTAIQDEMGVNIEDVVEGTGRLAGQAAMLGLSMEDTMAYVAAISKLTGQSGQAGGEQFSRILSVLQTGRGQAALTKNLGADTGIQAALSTRNYADAIKILMENYGDLDKAQQDNIATTLGGARQAAAINALLSQGTHVLDVAAKATDARGNADKRAAQISATLQVQVKKLQQNFVNLTKAVVDTGVLNFFYVLLRGANLLLSTLASVLTKANELADSNPLTRFAKHSIFGILGMLAAIKLLGVGFRALKTALGASGITAALATERARQVAPAAGAPTAGSALSRLNPFTGFGRADTYNGRHAAEQTRAERSWAARSTGWSGARLSGLGEALTSRGNSLMETRGLKPGVPQHALPGLLAGTAGAAGPLSYMRGDAGRTMARAGAGMNRLGSGLSSLSTRLASSAVAAGAASAAVGALTIALTAMIFEAFAAKQFADEQQKAYEDAASGKTEEEREEEKRYAGKQNELVAKNLKSLEGPGGMMRALGRGAANIGTVLSFGLFSDYKSSSEAVGDITDTKTKSGKNTDKALHKTMQDAFKRNREALLSGSIEQLEEANRLSKTEMDALRDDIQNSSMTAEQKATAQGELDNIRNAVNKSASKIQLRMEGLNSLDMLIGSQIQALGALTNSLTSAGASASDFPALVKALTKDIGIAEGSSIEDLLAGLEGPMSNLDRTKRFRDIARKKVESLQADLSNENLDTDKRDELTPLAMAAMAEYEQMIVSVLNQTVEGAQAISNELKAIGAYQFAADALNTALAEIDTEIERQREAGDAAAVARLQGQRRGVVKNQVDTRIEGQAILEQEARGRGRNTYANAQSETREAKVVLDAYEASYKAGDGVTRKELADARVRYNQALKAEADSLQAQTASALQLEIARTLNAVTRASLEEAAALNAVTFARAQFGEGSQQLNEALGRYAQSQEASFQAREAERAAAVQTSILNLAPGDAVAVATARRNEAQTAMDIARRYETSSTQYQQANQALIQAQREVNNAVRDVAAADAELNIAIAEAAGDRVAVARAQAAEAERLYQVALREAGGNTGAASVKRANAARIRAGAGERDAVFNSQVSTIDFQREMGEISANTAISMLQELLRQTNLTEEQRRQLRLKIKGLQADIRNTLTASGFNIPDQIKLPTAYEVRRSLGVDPYVQAGESALKELQSITAQSTMGALTMSPAGTTGSTTTVVNNNNNTPVVVNNTVSSPAMVEAVARRVVELISTQTNMGARANQTSPSLVRY